MRVHPAKYRSAGLYWQMPVVLLLLLAALLFNVFRDQRDGAREGPMMKRVRVVVLSQNVEANTILSPRDLKLKEFDLSAVPQGYFLNRKDLVACQTRGPVPADYPLVEHFLQDGCKVARSR